VRLLASLTLHVVPLLSGSAAICAQGTPEAHEPLTFAEPIQQQGQPADAIQAGDHASSGAVQALLQQLADSISSIQQTQRQQGTASTNSKAQEHASDLLSANPVQAVQVGVCLIAVQFSVLFDHTVQNSPKLTP